ncbi:hypothetical protein HRH25_02445 [Flavisolibacter sp. BT320]|nr:hypothetical protein [Flavisolibacter longurius]
MSALPEKLLSFQRNLHQDGSKAAAWTIIHDYFTFFNHEEWRQDLWQMLVGTLTSEQMDRLEKGIDRHNLFFFYEYTTLLLEAVSLLREKQGAKKRRKRRKECPAQQPQTPNAKPQTFLS